MGSSYAGEQRKENGKKKYRGTFPPGNAPLENSFEQDP
jgi:hypothetical protein